MWTNRGTRRRSRGTWGARIPSGGSRPRRPRAPCRRSRAVRRRLYRADFAAQVALEDELPRLAANYFPAPLSRDPVENLLYADTVVRLPDDMLTKVDRASMAHSLEVRVPFLAHTFVDWA